MKKEKDKFYNLILPIVTVLCVFVLWMVAAAIVDSEFILPSVSQTFTEIASLFLLKEFYLAFSSTFIRSLIAFVVSFCLALVLSILSTLNSKVQRIIAPLMSILRALPTIAVVLLLLFWTNSKVAPVIVTLLVVLPTAFTQLRSAFEAIDKTTVEAGMVDGASYFTAFMKIKVGQALPSVYSFVGSGLSLNLKLMVAAEVIASTANSIGYLLNTSKVYFEIAKMIAIVVITVIVSCVIEGVFSWLSKKSGEWRE